MLNLTLSQLMTPSPLSLASTVVLDDVAAVMAERRISSVLIVENNAVVGIVTELDILKSFARELGGNTPVSAVMAHPVKSAPQTLGFREAYHQMARDNIRHLLVVDDAGDPAGIVSLTDFERHLGAAFYRRLRDVQTVMQVVMPTMAPQASLAEALQAMHDLQTSCVVVVQSARPMGILTERDVVRLFHRHENRCRSLHEVMTGDPVVIPVGTSVSDAAALMHERGIRHLVVVDETGCFAGLLGEKDLVRHLEGDLVELARREQLQARRDLFESRSRWHVLFDMATQYMGVLDGEGHLLEANRSALALVAAERDQVIGRLFWETPWWRDDPEQARQLLCESLEEAAQNGQVTLEVSHNDAAGVPHQVVLSLRKLGDQPPRYLVEGRDVTDMKLIEDQLRLAASVFDNAHDAIMITDLDGHIIDVNPSFCRMTGYARAEAIGQSARMLNSGHHDQRYFETLFAKVIDDGFWTGEMWNRTCTGELMVVTMTISAVRDENDEMTHFVGVLTDITQKKAHEERLEQLAHYDVLTQLPNRTMLMDRMRVAIAQTSRKRAMLAMCYLDLDGFKPVNDRFGHHAGDLLLVEIAERLRTCLRAGDTAARMGGDEFVLLLNDITTLGELESILHRILDVIGEPVRVGEEEASVSASIGVTIYPDDGGDPDSLLRHADQAMYDAKREGRNCYKIFDVVRHTRARELRQLVQDVRDALARGDFRLYYQPRVNLGTGEVTGFEALLRWQLPDGRLRMPAEFLPALDQHEVIADIGLWVIHETLSQLETWHRDHGFQLPVSINVAARQLSQSDFLESLRRALRMHAGLPPNLIELEILETAALDDLSRVRSIMHACQDMGIRFSLDDFGTGYSSLAYLKALPANTLKIDQSFIRDMVDDPEALAIVEGVMGLTNAFQRAVIAEGVETLEHGVLLLRLGCSDAQGFAIAYPMPGDQVPGWMAQYQHPPQWLAEGRARWHQEDFPLIAAEIDHRRWLEGVLRQLESPTTTRLPSLLTSAENCRFGRWYQQHGRLHYSDLPEYHQVGAIHAQVHALTDQLVAGQLKLPGRELLALEAELVATNERLLAALRVLQQAVVNKHQHA